MSEFDALWMTASKESPLNAAATASSTFANLEPMRPSLPHNDKGNRAAATGLDYGKRVSRRAG